MALPLTAAHSPLYRSWRTSSPQLASAIALDSDGLRIMFLTFRDSTHTTVIVNQFAGGLVRSIQSAISNFSRGVGLPLSGRWRGSLSLWPFVTGAG